WDDLGEQRLAVQEDAGSGLHQPTGLVAGPRERGQGGQGVHHVADRGEPDEEDPHARTRARQPRSLASRARVAWSLGAPPLAIRPPYEQTTSRSGTVSGV